MRTNNFRVPMVKKKEPAQTGAKTAAKTPAKTPAKTSVQAKDAPIARRLLVEARGLSLHVPVITSADRKLMANPSRLLSDFYLARAKRSNSTLLDRVSFTLHPGERLGVIGANGAGKSTLLRVLAGIYTPSSGHLKVNGTAKGLFDISLGMHPEATGLENIYMRGLQMGLPIRQIRTLIPGVLEFSELGDAIEKRLATYSTGMRLRLAIAISTMIEPDILLLDEWIGAGDADFNAKVRQRMLGLVENSRGLVLATHNPMLMKFLCTNGLVLDKGRVVFYGGISEALDFYAAEHGGGAQTAN